MKNGFNSGIIQAAIKDKAALARKNTKQTGQQPKKAPAKKTPAKKTPVKKTPAKKSPAKKTPAKKSPAKKSPAKKTPAKGGRVPCVSGLRRSPRNR